MRIERVLLEHEREVAGGRRLAGDVVAGDQDRAGVRLLQAGEQAERGRLARPGRTEQHQELAVGDVEVDPVDGGHVAEVLADAPQRDLSHRRSPDTDRCRAHDRRAHRTPPGAPGRTRFRRSRPAPPAGGDGVRARSWPWAVSTVTIWVVPRYSVPNTSPRSGDASLKRTNSGRTPSASGPRAQDSRSAGTAICAPSMVTEDCPASTAPLEPQKAHRRAADEVGDEHGAGTLVDRPRGADLLDDAVVHDDDPVGHRHRFHLVVRHVQGRRVHALVQGAELAAHQLAHLRIERPERLVHQERPGLAHDGPPEGHPLAVAAGQPRHPAVEKVPDAEQRRGLLDPPPAFPARHALALQGKGDVVAHRHVRIEREELEHEGDVAPRGPKARHVLAVEQDLARGRQLQARDHPQRRRLAAPRRAQHDEELPALNGERGVVHRHEVVEALLDVPYADLGHHVTPGSGSR